MSLEVTVTYREERRDRLDTTCLYEIHQILPTQGWTEKSALKKEYVRHLLHTFLRALGQEWGGEDMFSKLDLGNGISLSSTP